ncbi:uncharacterized protein LOC134241216 [Saccostrea cucullata]|uniref:uncharacterized protein LOC134241216 n=1 Tax=Saccostrea cuccullata TaxID=36930 RepID=UPI002ED63AC5
MASLKMNLLVLTVAVLGVYLVHEISAASAHCGYHRHTTWNFRVCNSTHCKYYYRVYYGICYSSGNLAYDLKVSLNGEPLYYYRIIRRTKRSIETEDDVFEKVERSSNEAEERQTKSVRESEYHKILRDIDGQKASKRSTGYLTTEIS